MPRNVIDLFHASTGQIQTYTWVSDGSALTGQKIVSDYPPGQQSVPSIFIEVVSGYAGVVYTITCQLAIGVDTSGSTIWGAAHSVLDDSGVATITGSTSPKFEANIYSQSWWKENDGFRIIVTPDSGGTYTIRGSAILR